MGKRIGAFISLFLFGATGFLYPQNPPSNTAAKESQAADQAGAASSTTPDHARAYYHYMLARRYSELARAQNRTDLVDRAVTEYKEAIEADPDSLFLRVELADLYSQAGRIPEAIQQAEAVLKANPKQVEAHRLLATIYFHSLGENQPEQKAKENLAKAIEHLEAVTRLDPTDTNSFVLLGRLYKADNQNAKAEETFKRVLNSDPSSRAALFNLAEVYIDQGDYPEAISLLTKVPEMEMDVRWLGLLGYAYSQNREFAKSVDAYEKALAEDPGNQDIERAYAEALMNSGKTDAARAEYQKLLKADPQDGNTYLRLGRLDRQEGRFDQARQELERARALVPDNVEVPFELAQLEESTGNEDKAIQILEGLVKNSEHQDGQYTVSEANNRAIFLERLGQVYRNQEKYDQALETFKQIVALGKGQASRGESLIVETLRLDRQPQKALEEADAALKKDPNDRTLKLLKASILGEQGHVDEALTELQSMLDGKAGDVEIYRAIAQVDSQAKRFPEAEAAAQKALAASSKPDDQEFGRFLLGSIYERQKKYDLAEQEFKKVLSTDPQNAAAANYLGYMLADRGVRLDESVKYIQKALQLEPNNGAYLDSLGWAYFKMHRLDLAENQLEKAARLITTDPTIHEHLGHIYLELGKKRQAQELWERALKEWPQAVGSDFDADQAAKLRKQLDQLRNTLDGEKSTAKRN
ncbi:MAG TPA: tetratricopeptide repeat protein [Terriglobia bacterium]|nr:tetratricopeptide repeat protein [Terriglobia bacterium]